MTDHPASSWALSRIPGLGCVCPCRSTRAKGGSYLGAVPFLIAVTALLVLASGVVLLATYNARSPVASLQILSHAVPQGWLVRAYHASGTTLLAGLVYLGLFHGLLTRAYRAPGEYAWMLGVKLLAVLLAASWFGYVLSGGAGGYWSYQRAMMAALQFHGAARGLALWVLSGGLPKLLVLHLLLALSAGLALWAWLAARAKVRATPPPGEAVPFYPYYAAQYLVALCALGFVGALLIGFLPHLGMPALNAVPGSGLSFAANPGLPWYLAPLGAAAGSFHGAWGGIGAVIALAVTLYAVPWLDLAPPEAPPSRLHQALTWLLGAVVVALGVDGTMPGCPLAPVLDPLLTLYVFLHFLVLLPLVTWGRAK
ncbi:cytochrome b N-terminal domain-containing protein [Acidocella sp.]|uniref:cytochrome b N-terminal domain-containing protein n=1 Tax=Acidocella sp. TaxID=50710 RepID=UPI002624A708|nr:cytochrome b N-terminal domain-containing protein [Acidocella sp.]